MNAKLNYIKSSSPIAETRPILVFVPGGPGLSSKTLTGFEILSRSFDLIFIDPPGTAELPKPKNPTFESILDSIEIPLRDLNRPIILVGHSFAGYQVAQLIKRNNLKVAGLVCISAPLSKTAFDSLVTQYEKFKTPEIVKTEIEWDKNKNIQTMREWFASYGVLFFTKNSQEKGRTLILKDDMSVASFIGIRDVEIDEELLSLLKTTKIPKLSIAGKMDKLVTPDSIQKDANQAGFEFHVLENTGHFMNLDQPEAAARLIENKFIGSR